MGSLKRITRRTVLRVAAVSDCWICHQPSSVKPLNDIPLLSSLKELNRSSCSSSFRLLDMSQAQQFQTAARRTPLKQFERAEQFFV
jgi:hypothetical protein